MAGDADTAGDATAVSGDSGAQDGSGGRGVSGDGDNSAGTGNHSGGETKASEGSQGGKSTYGPAQRASYLRRTSRKRELTADESSWLDEYNAGKGRKKSEAKKESRNAATPVVLSRSPSSRVSRPPVIHETQSWRAKHNGADNNGRELFCTMVADQWHQLLCAMEKEIAEAGLTPIVQVSNQETRSLLILAVDDLAPDFIKASPAIVVAFKTTALTTQRVAKAKAIKEAKDKKDRAIHVLRNNPQATVTAIAPTLVPPPQTEPPVNGSPAPKDETSVNISAHGKLLPQNHVIR